MYNAYAQFVTRNFPFVWAHRLEVPIVGGVAGISFALILAGSIDANEWPWYFMALSTVLGAVSIMWLVSISRTLHLKYSIKASKYPVLTVVVLGAILLNSASFIFFPHTGEMLTQLFWIYSGLVSVCAIFAVLARKTSVYNTFASFFSFVFIFGFVIVVANVVMARKTIEPEWFRSGGWFLMWYAFVSFATVVGIIGALRKPLWKHRERIFGIALFVFSAGSLYVVYAIITAAQPPNIPVWPFVGLLVLSVVIGETILAAMRSSAYARPR
jgi:hypothetical protein